MIPPLPRRTIIGRIILDISREEHMLTSHKLVNEAGDISVKYDRSSNAIPTLFTNTPTSMVDVTRVISVSSDE